MDRPLLVPRKLLYEVELTSTDYRMLLWLISINHDTVQIEQLELAEELGISRETVTRSLKRLESGGYIEKQKRFEGEPGTHLKYKILWGWNQ